MEYTVVKESYLLDFNEQVNRYLKNGWKLQGGVSVGFSRMESPFYCQAMIKEKHYENIRN